MYSSYNSIELNIFIPLGERSQIFPRINSRKHLHNMYLIISTSISHLISKLLLQEVLVVVNLQCFPYCQDFIKHKLVLYYWMEQIQKILIQNSCANILEQLVNNQFFQYNLQKQYQINMDSATYQQIIQASKLAYAYQFIINNSQITQFFTPSADNIQEKYNKQGFDRSVGLKGSPISGGQKQRVSIATSILRKSNIFLLDQATSSLDAGSQQKVLLCLDQLLVNKPCISIAHRFETIKRLKLYIFLIKRSCLKRQLGRISKQEWAFRKVIKLYSQ